MQPELRAIDAYNARERLVEWVRSFGVTTIHTGHAPGETISGQTMITKTFGNTIDDVTLVCHNRCLPWARGLVLKEKAANDEFKNTFVSSKVFLKSHGEEALIR